MTTTAASDGAEVDLEGPFGARELRNLRALGRIDSLNLTKQPLVTANIAKGLASLSSVRRLRIWCTITRTAMRHAISIPGLEDLDIHSLRHPGALANFADATDLKDFLCDFYPRMTYWRSHARPIWKSFGRMARNCRRAS